MDEHEKLVEYSEMTSFNFNSKEFQEVRKDYLECKNIIFSMTENFLNLFKKSNAVKYYEGGQKNEQKGI